jgi:hypothetical protein
VKQVAVCSACHKQATIEEIEIRQDGMTALWCASCLQARNRFFQAVEHWQQERALRAERLTNIVRDFREDPKLSLLEFGTFALCRYLQRWAEEESKATR